MASSLMSLVSNLVSTSGPEGSVAERYMHCRLKEGLQDQVLCQGYANGKVDISTVRAAARGEAERAQSVTDRYVSCRNDFHGSAEQCQDYAQGKMSKAALIDATVSHVRDAEVEVAAAMRAPAQREVARPQLWAHQAVAAQRFAQAAPVNRAEGIAEDVAQAKRLAELASVQSVKVVDHGEAVKTMVMIDGKGLRIRAEYADGHVAFLHGAQKERYEMMALSLLENTAGYVERNPIQRHNGTIIFRVNMQNQIADYNMISNDTTVPAEMRENAREAADDWTQYKHVCANAKAVTVEYESPHFSMMVIGYHAHLPSDASSWADVVFSAN